MQHEITHAVKMKETRGGAAAGSAMPSRPRRASPSPAPAPAPARLRPRKRLNMSGSARGGWWTTSCAPRAPAPTTPPSSSAPCPRRPARLRREALGQRGEGAGRGVLPALLLGLADPLGGWCMSGWHPLFRDVGTPPVRRPLPPQRSPRHGSLAHPRFHLCAAWERAAGPTRSCQPRRSDACHRQPQPSAPDRQPARGLHRRVPHRRAVVPLLFKFNLWIAVFVRRLLLLD